jgi:microcystin-dependent protein
LTNTTMSTDGVTLGATGGAQTVTLSAGNHASHTHTGTSPQTAITNGSGTGLVAPLTSHANTQLSTASGTNFIPSTEFVNAFVEQMTLTIANQGSATPVNKMPPAIVCNYIIKT